MGSVGKLIVISGPSGAGKSTVVREVIRRTGAAFSVSATTRTPRPCEKSGREYRFVDRSTFEEMIDRGELLEWAEVYGRLYGTPAEAVRKAIADGKVVILEIDVQGALQVAQKMPDATFILILPPSDEEQARRLDGRGTEDEKSRRQRLEKANEEIDAAIAGGVYKYKIVNDELESTIRQVIAAINEESGND